MIFDLAKLSNSGKWHIIRKYRGARAYEVKSYCNRRFWPTKTKRVEDLVEPAIEGNMCLTCQGARYEEMIMPRKKVTPTKPASNINPKHYALQVNGQPIQVVDIMEALFHDDLHAAHAFKYLARAGRKPDQSHSQDINKAIWWLVRGQVQSGVKAIELPPGAEKIIHIPEK